MKTKVTFKDSFDNSQMSVEITGSGNIRLGMGRMMYGCRSMISRNLSKNASNLL